MVHPNGMVNKGNKNAVNWRKVKKNKNIKKTKKHDKNACMSGACPVVSGGVRCVSGMSGVSGYEWEPSKRLAAST